MSIRDARTARDTAMDIQALNHRQRFLYANTTPERDSLLEHLVFLQAKYRIDAEDMLGPFKCLRDGMEANDAELHGERQITGLLNDLAATAHRADGAAGPVMVMSIKALASTLRPHLRVLGRPAGHTAADLDHARSAVTAIVRSVPADRLRSESLRHELREHAHRTLMGFVNRVTA